MMKVTQISRMTIAERLRTMEQLWDSLLGDEDKMESPSWHEEILKKRKQSMQEGKAEFMTIDELKTTRKS